MLWYVGTLWDDFLYVSPTWTRSPNGTRSLIGIGIALKCNPGFPALSRHPTLCRKVSQGRNPSRSRSPSSTRSPTNTKSP